MMQHNTKKRQFACGVFKASTDMELILNTYCLWLCETTN